MQVDSIAGSYPITISAASSRGVEPTPPDSQPELSRPRSVPVSSLEDLENGRTRSSSVSARKVNRADDAFKKVNERINELVQSFQRHLHFEIHDKTGIMFVRVTDAKEGKVLRELPMKEVLDTLARIQEAVGLLMDNKA